MDDPRTSIFAPLRGLWLPLVTPFRDGALDETSLRRLVRHYAAMPLDGLILAATTGESLTLEPRETERLVFTVREECAGIRTVPILPRPVRQQHGALLDTLDEHGGLADRRLSDFLPLLFAAVATRAELHFTALADRARHPVALYNIPYRTGVNLGNDAMLRLAGHPNIVGLKDCGADRASVARTAAARRPRFCAC